jgi:hypothetical protein
MKVGDLVRLKHASTPASRNRTAIVTKISRWSGNCTIVFMATGHKWEAIESMLEVCSSANG